ncbi:MAG: RnfABCDGE type electron transport complex subunit G [Prevotella sp.]|nr:RnfABCDGE type electron transport complex subunit G [Prevotella sp.]MDY4039189.1 RnfABCDGE type electron transport complex subunit G [Prevotella sp.]
MEKLRSSLQNMVMVLVGVSIVIGALLAFVNHVTAKPIAEKAEKTLASGIKAVMNSNQVKVDEPVEVLRDFEGKILEFVIHPCTDLQGKSLGAAVESTTGGFGGDLKVLVGFDPDGKILGYTILETSETPGLGAKAEKWFQKDGKGSIIGMSPADGTLHVRQDSKSGNAVDAITASTITSRAFLKAVNQAYEVYRQKDKSAAMAAVNQ